MPEDYYKILGVTPVATADEIKKAWRKQVLAWHPDRNDDPLAVEQFRRITLVYEVLSDPVQRRDYDRSSIAFARKPDTFQHHYLEMRLNRMAKKHGLDTRGRGMMRGIDMKTGEAADRVTSAAFDRGLIIETSGAYDEIVKVLAPLVIDDAVFAQGLDILEECVDLALAPAFNVAAD